MGRLWRREPDRMETFARQIDEKKGGFDSSMKKTMEIVKGMNSYFDDPTSREFVKRFEGFEKDMIKLSEIMDDFSKALSDAARIIRDITNTN